MKNKKTGAWKKKDPKTWSQEDVCEWISTFGPSYAPFVEKFTLAGIDGETLYLIDYEDIERDLGKGLKQRKIWKEISALVQKYPHEVSGGCPAPSRESESQLVE